MTTHSNGHQTSAPAPGSAIYVDTENLRDSDHAQSIVSQIISGWPSDRPAVTSVSLYVRADKEALWRLWMESSYPDLRVRVRGIQHFSNHRAKNSADLAITADAVDDLINRHAAMVAVVSNDSDFGALFVKVQELTAGAPRDSSAFLWVTVPDAGGVSDEIDQFIPAQFRWDLPLAAPATTTPVPQAASQFQANSQPRSTPSVTPPIPKPRVEVAKEAIAEELIRRLPIGRFKVAEAHQVLRARWPDHPAAGDASKMGQFLLNELWPILEKLGVTMPRKSSPRTYEITSDAKARFQQPPPPASKPVPESPEPTPSQLAGVVASHIDDDLFGATEALNAIKARWPAHPAASYTAAQFGAWFAKQLWPVMEQHGVVLAKDKPRRYEITPDARHRLTSIV